MNDFQQLYEQAQTKLADLLQQYQGVAVACSGGADSTALFHLLCEIRNEKKNFPLAIYHVNFGLRGKDSDDDQRFLEDLAASKKVPIFVRNCSKEGFVKPQNLTTQQWAREVRYQFFNELADQNYAIALAHHLDDLKENLLLRLGRGVGVASLKGMSEWHAPYYRPLLDTSKSQLLEYLSRHKLPFREDFTNANMDYKRNLVRLELMPMMESHFPNMMDNLLSYANEAQEFVRYTESRLPSGLVLSNEENLCLQTEELRTVPKAVFFHIIAKKLPRPVAGTILNRALLEKMYLAVHRQQNLTLTLKNQLGRIRITKSTLIHYKIEDSKAQISLSEKSRNSSGLKKKFQKSALKSKGES